LPARCWFRLDAVVSADSYERPLRDEQQAFVRELDALSLADCKQQSSARRANQGYSQDKPKRCISRLATLAANCGLGVIGATGSRGSLGGVRGEVHARVLA
jgi:hypothetical protein